MRIYWLSKSPWPSLSLSGFLHKFHCRQYSHRCQYCDLQSESSCSQRSECCHKTFGQSHGQVQQQQYGPNFLTRFPTISYTKCQRSAHHVLSKPIDMEEKVLSFNYEDQRKPQIADFLWSWFNHSVLRTNF